MREKFNNKYNIWLKKPKDGNWEELSYHLKVTDHGTICRESLKDACEEQNGKDGKDYTNGLTTGKRQPFGYNAQEYKHAVRVREMQILLEKHDKDEITEQETNRYKKLRLMERGKYKAKDYKSTGENTYKLKKLSMEMAKLAKIRIEEGLDNE